MTAYKFVTTTTFDKEFKKLDLKYLEENWQQQNEKIIK